MKKLSPRGICLIGLRNNGLVEWVAWLITVVVFSLMLLVNLCGGANIPVLFVVITGGSLLYVSRWVFNNLFIPIGMHALQDMAFFLLTGMYVVGESLPENILDFQFASFLVLLPAPILFIIFGRGIYLIQAPQDGRNSF